jgi:hypothetical protein
MTPYSKEVGPPFRPKKLANGLEDRDDMTKPFLVQRKK